MVIYAEHLDESENNDWSAQTQTLDFPRFCDAYKIGLPVAIPCGNAYWFLNIHFDMINTMSTMLM